MKERHDKGSFDARSAAPADANPRSMTPSIMIRLRDATSAVHARIEKNPRLAALLAPDLTYEQYLDVLLRYHAYFSQTEPIMMAALEHILPRAELELRRKLPLIEVDLAEVGFHPPSATPVIESSSIGQVLGRLYVHEGASLGGRLIHGALKRTLGAKGRIPIRFFEGYGHKSAEVWRGTKFLIESNLGNEHAMEEAIFVANQAFTELDAVMRS